MHVKQEDTWDIWKQPRLEEKKVSNNVAQMETQLVTYVSGICVVFATLDDASWAEQVVTLPTQGIKFISESQFMQSIYSVCKRVTDGQSQTWHLRFFPVNPWAKQWTQSAQK